MHRARLTFLIGAYLSAGAALAALAAAPAPPATTPSTQKGFTGAFKAMAYYDDACRRCHGPQGSFYGSELGKGLSDAQLKDIVDKMATGPGNSPLEKDQLEVETAFHRALVAGTPYVSVTELEGEKIAGEVMPEAKVTLKIAGKEIAAKVEDQSWSVTIPSGTRPADITIVAELKGKKTELALKSRTFSHPAPATQAAK